MMSGICGIFSLANPGQASSENLRKMMEALRHRGTAAQRLFVDDSAGIAIGHLFTPGFSSLEEEMLPAWHEDENYIVALDGAVFNPGEFLSSPTDRAGQEQSTAAVATHLREHAEAFPEKLDGNFALAVWDKKHRELWLARDPLGARPLYYAYSPGQKLLLFASELKGIMAHPAATPQLSREGLTAYLTFGYIPAPLSSFKEVYKIFPGEVLKIEAGGQPRLRQYWNIPPYRPLPGDIEWFASRLREQVVQSVAKHIGNIQRLGVFLSGGIDSTIVLGVLKMLGIPERHTFTLGFYTQPEKSHLNVDLYWAGQTAQQYATCHHPIVIEAGHDPGGLLPHIFRQFDEPMLTPNAYSKYFLSEAARQAGIHACLTGSNVGPLLERPTRKQIEKLYQKVGQQASVEELVLYQRTKLFSFQEQSELLAEPITENREMAFSVIARYGQGLESDDVCDLIFAIPTRMQGTEKSLTVVDRTAALNGVEVRHPFYNSRLLQFANGIPPQFKGSESESMNKAVLKQAFADLLPQEIAQREPAGYPSYYWTNGEVEALKQHLLSPAALKRSGLLRPDTVQKIIEEDKTSTRKSAGKRTWGLLVLQAWYELYINRNDPWGG